MRRVKPRLVLVEELEKRVLLAHGPTVLPDGGLEVRLDETLDQFGFQVPMFQAFDDPNDNAEPLVAFSIFDTGASVITFSANDQFFFDLAQNDGIPVKIPCGAEAHGVGGSLVGHVSEPITIMADGLHVSTLIFDSFGFPIFDINFEPDEAAIVQDVQAMIGALIGPEKDGGCTPAASEILPTITGTPILEPTATNPDGLAINIRPIGEILDFSGFGEEFEGLKIPVPGARFQATGLGIPDDPACTFQNPDGSTEEICTDPVRIALDFVGLNNHPNPGETITESFNPVHNHVEIQDDATVLEDQVFLFDTGAQLSIISSEHADRFGLDLNNPECGTISVQGAAGIVEDLSCFLLDRMSVPLVGGGDLTFFDVPVYVLDIVDFIDGIWGMNLFNYASALNYDPHQSDGAVLDLSFFTKHFIELPDIDPDAQAILNLSMPGFNAVIQGQQLPRFDIPTPPSVGLSGPGITNDSTPLFHANVTDDNPLPDDLTVLLDIDLDGNGSFEANEESLYAARVVDGTAEFELTAPLADGDYEVRARARDRDGLEGSSELLELSIDATPPTFDAHPQVIVVDAADFLPEPVGYQLPTASDNFPQAPTVSCSADSGTVFPLGESTVSCQARDEAGNQESTSFTVQLNPPPKAEDLVLAGFGANPAGFAQLELQYTIVRGLATDFEIGFFASADGNWDPRDREVGNRLVVTEFDDRVEGAHSTPVNQDAIDAMIEDMSVGFLLAVIDPDEQFGEANLLNNDLSFFGALHRESGAALVLRGRDSSDGRSGSADDTVSLTLVEGNLEVDGLFPAPVRFDPAEISSIHMLLHDGDDQVQSSDQIPIPLNVRAGAGDDVIFGSGSRDTIRGGEGNDLVQGLGGDDQIFAGDGDDTVKAGNGNDRVRGDAGNDVISGGFGNDFLSGGLDADVVTGQAGGDVITGAGGNDILRGSDGSDRILGQDDDDRIQGGKGNDTLNGGRGTDRVVGQGGNDRIVGAAGADILSGGAGHDVLLGNGDDDRLLGSSGNDILDGGLGDDDLRPGSGKDRCRIGRTLKPC